MSASSSSNEPSPGLEMEVRHPDERHPAPAVGAHRAACAGAQLLGGLARAEEAAQHARLDDRLAPRRNPLVVERERAEALGRRRVGRDVHLLRAVAQGSEVVRREEARARVRGLGAVDTVELGRVADGLVHLHDRLLRREDDGRPAGRALGCEQERGGLLADPRRLSVEVQPLDELPAALDADARVLARVAPDLGHVAGGRIGVDPASGLVDLLLDVRPLGRDEHLVLALGAHHRDGDLDVRVLHALFRPQAEVDLVREGDRERVALERGSILARLTRRRVRARSGAGPDAARAKAVARSAVSRAAESSSRPIPANPHAPSTSTRTPMPSLSVSLRSSSWPFFVITDWRRSETARASAYVAPAPSAASTAASASAFTGQHYPWLHCESRAGGGIGRRARLRALWG